MLYQFITLISYQSFIICVCTLKRTSNSSIYIFGISVLAHEHTFNYFTFSLQLQYILWHISSSDKVGRWTLAEGEGSLTPPQF